MKRLCLTGLCALLVLGLVACSSGQKTNPSTAALGQSSQVDDLFSQIQEKGEITIATEGTYAPWSFHDEDGTLVGYDVEVASRVAEKLGVKATFVECPWDGIFSGLDAGRYDIVANEVEITDERAEKYDFSDPYAYIHTAIIVAADNDDIHSFEDLAGKTTANTLTSTYAALAERYGATTEGVDTLEQTLNLVLSGRVDATLNADVSFYDYMNVHPDAQLKIAALTDEPVVASIPMRKGSDTLRTAINAALSQLREEGVLTELSQKYFRTDISAESDGTKP